MSSYGQPGQPGQQSGYGQFDQQSGYNQPPAASGYGTGYDAGYGQSSGPAGNYPAYAQNYGAPAYAQNYAYGGGQPPSRPGIVITAAVLGFVVGALAVIAAIALFAGGSTLVGVDDGGTGLAGSFVGILVFLGVLVLAIAVIMIWGSVLAVTGRSRVLLIVGSSILTALALISLLGALGSDQSDSSGVISALVLLVISVATLVLISLSPSGQYFAAVRARRRR